MAPGDSPLVARRRVRLAVREAREALGMTQGQVAEAMEWSLSKVMRIESGEVTISPNDLRPLLDYLGVTARSSVDELVQDARVARRRQMWWDEPRFREHLTPAMRQLVQYEAEATTVRHFNTMIIPGRLQTRAYAESILSGYRDELPAEVLEARLEVRMRRRDELLARRLPLRIFLLLDESVLHRQVGGTQVLGDQLSDLLRLSEDKRLLARVVPFSLGAPIPMLAAYEILDLGDDDAVMYRESHIYDEIVEDRSKISRERETFDQLWDRALDETNSVRLIENRAKSLLSAVRKPLG